MRYERVEDLSRWDSIWATPIDHKVNAVADAFVKYVVMEDDETEPLLAIGLYEASTIDRRPLLWLVPGRKLRPIHWRRLQGLLATLRSIVPDAIAYVDETNKKAATLIRATGMSPVAGDEKDRMYRWL